MMIRLGESFKVIGLTLPQEAKPLHLVWIEAGKFLMGSPADEPGVAWEDSPPFEATLSKGFWLGQYPVTQSHWSAVMNTNPSHFREDNRDRPVENVSWQDALMFCRELNRRLVNELPAGYTFGLPTEMHWEYACRAGTQTPYYSGASIEDLLRVAWCAENSGEETHAVGEKEPNAWGLHEMHGNVLEWCCDVPTDYPTGRAADWTGSGDSPYRVIRGGSWKTPCDSGDLRSAAGGYARVDLRQPWVGCRLCLRWLDPGGNTI